MFGQLKRLVALVGSPEDEQEQNMKEASEGIHRFGGCLGRSGKGQPWSVLIKRGGTGSKKGNGEGALWVTAQQALAMFLGHLGRSVAREHGENVSGTGRASSNRTHIDGIMTNE